MMNTVAKLKIIIPLAGLFSGILMFLALLSMLINTTLFNNEFHFDTLTKIGLSNYITKTAKEKSSEIFADQEQIDTFISSAITSELVNKNMESLVTGLLDYVKGHSDILPDLYLRVHSENGSEPPVYSHDKSITFSSLVSIDKINLRLLTMFSDEQKINNTLSAISLVQLTTKNIMILSILLLIFTFMLLLQRTPSEILASIKLSVVVYSLLCLLTYVFLYKMCNVELPYILSMINVTMPEIREIIRNYTLSFLSIIMYNLFFSIILLPVGIQIGFLLLKIMLTKMKASGEETSPIEDLYDLGEASLSGSAPIHAKKHPTVQASHIYLGLLALLIFSIYMLLSIAVEEYNDRNLDSVVTYLSRKNTNNKIIDARGYGICYLDVIVLDGITQQPLEGAEISIYRTDSSDISLKRSFTDNKGSSVFLLEKGSYRLLLDAISTQADWVFPDMQNLDFDLQKTGKNELMLITEKHFNGEISILSSTIQYLP